ncbi:Tat pathway signal sequence domain protein [Corynebacterium efficiens YS-314]|nr:Tat pathway signal sequence domain protein [Corynebacterium efficiens YS-314]
MSVVLSGFSTSDQQTGRTMGQISRRLRAGAAGGAVLGLGAVVTLAAWSDVQTFEGSFQAGSFGILGSADGVTWSNNTDTPLELTFAGSDNLVPGTAVYAGYHLKNIGTIPAHITYSVTAQGALTLDTDLTYQLVRTAGPLCDATAVAGGTAVTAGEEFTLGAEATQAYCLEVTLSGDYGEDLAESSAVTWRFDAVQ